MIFRIESPGAHSVSFASDLFGWDRPRPMKRAGDHWELSVDLPDDSRVEYQFVVDGHWTLDPTHDTHVSNGIGGFNSVFEGKAYRYDCPNDTPKQTILRYARQVAGHADARTITVFAPESAKQDLPIFIYADGGDYETFCKPQNIFANLGLEVATVLVPPCNRMSEYWKSSAPYEEYIVHDVLPAVRNLVRKASKAPQDVYVGGASLGGLISMRIAQRYPDIVQGGVHSQSGAFWASPGVLAISALKRLHPDLKLFFDWGRFEGVLTVSNDRMTDALRRLEKPHGVAISNEGHNWTAWRARFAAGANYLCSDNSKKSL
ncbi:MAG: hypothetical protein J0L72_06745 [Armatimonadetes bacterium]|nr:hypothetical protein [Armatimonadota bacterium]